MLNALAAPLGLDENRSADERGGGNEKLSNTLLDGNKLDAVARGGRRRADGGEGTWAGLHINNNKQGMRAGADERIIDGNDTLDGMRDAKPDKKDDAAHDYVDLDKQLWWVIFNMHDGEGDTLETMKGTGDTYHDEMRREDEKEEEQLHRHAHRCSHDAVEVSEPGGRTEVT